MPTTPSIPSVRTRNQHLNACNRKSPPFLSNPTTAPNVGIHGTMRRGLHTANLQVQASRSLLCARSAELQDANPTTSTVRQRDTNTGTINPLVLKLRCLTHIFLNTVRCLQVEADGIIHNCHHVSEATHQSNTPFLSTSDRITEGSKLDGVITSTTYAHALPTFFDWRTGPRGVAFVNDSLSALYGLSDKSAGLLKVANNLLSEATVPGPPLLARSTGLSTRYNSHPRTAGDISHLSVGNVAATAAANPTADFELGSLFVESGGFPFGACFPDTMGGYSVLQQIKRKAGGLPVMTGETGNATLESLYGAPMPALSPVTEISTLLAQTSHGSIGKVISSDEYNVSVASPAAVLPAGSRVVQTPDGPAILLSSLHTMAHPVASTTYPRRFQHWTEEEDELLKAAAALEGGPPCNWTKISRKYFLGSRTDTQCKGRWKKVRASNYYGPSLCSIRWIVYLTYLTPSVLNCTVRRHSNLESVVRHGKPTKTNTSSKRVRAAKLGPLSLPFCPVESLSRFANATSTTWIRSSSGLLGRSRRRSSFTKPKSAWAISGAVFLNCFPDVPRTPSRTAGTTPR